VVERVNGGKGRWSRVKEIGVLTRPEKRPVLYVARAAAESVHSAAARGAHERGTENLLAGIPGKTFGKKKKKKKKKKKENIGRPGYGKTTQRGKKNIEPLMS